MSFPTLQRKFRASLLCLALTAPLSYAFAPDTANDPAVDCPVAFQPYSSEKTTLLDLMLNPAAKAIVDRDLPAVFSKLPPILMKPTPPTLADILTLHVLASEFGAISPADFQKVDRDLAALPVTREAAIARCARYDHTPPVLPSTLQRPAVLVFSKSNGFRDDPSVNAGAAAVTAIATHHHWSVFSTDNAAVFTTAALKHFDAVVWNNVSGDVLTIPQRRDFKAYIENGGGFAGLHGSGGDFYYDWDWYADRLLGARFKSHPMNPQFQAAKLKVDDPKSPIVHSLPAEWTMTDEWYSFQNNPRKTGAHVLVTLDESSYHPVAGKLDLHMGDHPIAWTRCVGKGRSFYTAIGHRPESYSDPNTLKLIDQALAWAAGPASGSCPAVATQ